MAAGRPWRVAVDAAALASMEVAEWVRDMQLGWYGQTLRAINTTPNQIGELIVVTPRIEKLGEATRFS
jgi:hypothetical protein